MQATIPDDDGPTIGHALKTGREYMWNRLNASHRRDELARRFHEPLAELARESALRVPPPGPTEIRAAYLVDRGAVDAFFTRVTGSSARASPRRWCARAVSPVHVQRVARPRDRPVATLGRR